MPQKPKARKGSGKAKGQGRSERASSEKTQSERFIETARAIGVDEDGKEFDLALRKIIPRRSAKSK
jgi:hypothetical protein